MLVSNDSMSLSPGMRVCSPVRHNPVREGITDGAVRSSAETNHHNQQGRRRWQGISESTVAEMALRLRCPN
jgi:hypothetical protein